MATTNNKRYSLIVFWGITAFCLIYMWLPPSCRAQVLSGITGVVTDSTGAVVQNAKVTITNVATGIVTHTTTSSAGGYTITDLIPGQYTVSADAAGFKKEVQSNVHVDVGTHATVNFALSAGTTSETINVTASSIALNASEPQLGTTIEPEVVKALPTEISGYGRQIDSFIFLAPGVQGSATSAGFGSFSKRINGGVDFSSEVLFDGIPVTQSETPGFQTYINPPFEMVSEFAVVRSVFSVQYGLAQGAVTYNMASGTNKLHGDAFEINRNSFFDSKGAYPPLVNGHPETPINHQNNYGFTVGGPVVLPKLYNGRNRTFFHVSVEWYKQNLQATSPGTVPTIAEKQGDFSNFVDASGNQIPIFDPLTGEQFPGNVIPKSRFSAVSKTLLPLIPDPSRQGQFSNQLNNAAPQGPVLPNIQHIWGYHVDHNLTDSQSLHFSQWRNSDSRTAYTLPPIVTLSNLLQSAMDYPTLGTGILLKYTNTLSPNLVMTVGAGGVEQNNAQNNHLRNVDFPGAQNSEVLPNINFGGQFAPTAWGVPGGNVTANNRKLGLTFVNNWLWTHGRQTFNIGVEVRRAYQDDTECSYCGGSMNFSNLTTSNQDGSPGALSNGSGFASFLLGYVDSADRIFNQELKLRNLDVSPYIQDDVRITPKLTANVGMRWDIMRPFTENHNNVAFMDPNIANPGADNLLGAITKLGHCTGCAGYDRADIHWGHVEPRAGFSYMLNNKTVLQSGFAISVLDGGAYEFGDNKIGANYGPLLAGTFERFSTGTYKPAYGQWDNNPLPAPPPQPFSPAINLGTSVQTFNQNDGLAPYDQAWNVSIQRELPWDTFLTAAYVGNRAVHLPSNLNPLNQPNPAVLDLAQQYYAQDPNFLGEPVNSPIAQQAGIKIPYSSFLQDFGGGATVEQALRPYPQYGGIGNTFDMAGSVSYNAFQVQAEKRFTDGLAFLASYTLSRTMGNVNSGLGSFAAAPLNKFNQTAEYAISPSDQTNITSVSGTYELPIGRGKKYLNGSRALDLLAGGWQISAIVHYESGTPFGVVEGGNPLLNGYNRPNIVSSKSPKTFSYDRVYHGLPLFNTDAFQVTANPWVLGNAHAAYPGLRNPFYSNEDVNLAKHFHFGEGISAKLQVDYFNAFNRVEFFGPDANASDSTFGLVGQGQANANRQGQAVFRIEF